MSMTTTKITCRCGSSIESAFTSEVTDWQNRHDKCLANTREWVSMPDADIKGLWPFTAYQDFSLRFARDVEAALREKNDGNK